MKTSCFRVWRLLIELAGYLLPIARGPELRAQWVVDWWLSTREHNARIFDQKTSTAAQLFADIKDGNLHLEGSWWSEQLF
uniref:Uncharacterized protein n=2 Tax=Oryza TaxID=4527 RepID=A0A0E0P5U8_ORYRU